MQTRALRTLVEIDKAGAFAAAATRLNMTLSAVSMQMKALEADLGATLFDRSSRPPRLTPLGRSVCDRARRILAIEAEVRENCDVHDRLAGRYRIGFVPTASVRLLPTFLLNARRLAGAVSFEIVTGLSDALEAKVKDGDLDFAVVTASAGRDAGLEYRTLREETLAFAAPPDPDFGTPSELIARIPFLHFMPSSGIGKLISGRMEGLIGRGRGHLVLDSVEAIMECVNRGVGFTLLPEPDIRRYGLPQTRILPSGGSGPESLSRRVALVSPASRRGLAQAGLIEALFAE